MKHHSRIKYKIFTRMGTKGLKKCLIIGGWLVLWQVFSARLNQPLLCAGPLDTLQALWKVVMSETSWLMIGNSIARISLGFISAVLLGSLCAYLAYEISLVRELLAPVMALIKAIPVASFVVLILAWLSSRNLSVFVAGLVTFPIVYFDVLHCLMSLDFKMVQLIHIFRVKWSKCVRYLYLPAIMERLCNTTRITIGLSIRAGVAAELIGLPRTSIGEAIYKAKLYFSVADLFAWTILIVFLCFTCERLALYLCERIEGRLLHDQHKKYV